ncbi:hypothetical protein CMV_021254 [Castanea mollissima]|uniref:Uncharacterized protein n=1 Tax=Castanea mollissima TaxID=60419 RepID=A0A8J4QWI1_9ROSI|nr:hypothetical protein CMV_021254 [Castanea mollissima]
MMEGGVRYLEVKQLLLLLYHQAITFYLLKSEGQPIRDHPVLARLVEIKSLLDKTKQLDGNLPSELEEFLNNNQGVEMVVKLGREITTLSSDSFTKDQGPYPSAETRETTVSHETAELENVEPLKGNENKAGKHNGSDQVGVQSMEMLIVRVALEERLNQEVHKQSDIILLDANGNIVESDDEIPVFVLKGINDDEDEDDELQKLSFELPLDVKDMIRAVPLQIYGEKQDNLVWKGSQDGDFHLASAYKLARLETTDVQTFHGNWIWKLDTLPKKS